MPFKPGQSGNPKGRPPVGESIAECVRRYGGESGEKYVQRLDKLAEHKDPRVSVAAIEALLNRGFGKAPAELNLTGKLETVTQVTHKHE